MPPNVRNGPYNPINNNAQNGTLYEHIAIYNDYKPDEIDEIYVSDDRAKELNMFADDNTAVFNFCTKLYEHIKISGHIYGYHVKNSPKYDTKRSSPNTWGFDVVSDNIVRDFNAINIKVEHSRSKKKKEFVITLKLMGGHVTEFKKFCKILKNYLLPKLGQGGRRTRRMRRMRRMRLIQRTRRHGGTTSINVSIPRNGPMPSAYPSSFKNIRQKLSVTARKQSTSNHTSNNTVAKSISSNNSNSNNSNYIPPRILKRSSGIRPNYMQAISNELAAEEAIQHAERQQMARNRFGRKITKKIFRPIANAAYGLFSH